MPELGCGKSTAFLYDQGGEKMIGEITSVVTCNYGRELDEFSEATIVVGGPRDEACCELLGKIEPWRHEIVIFRDGVRSWEGPVRNVHSKDGQVIIDVKDVLAWTDRQINEGVSDAIVFPPTLHWSAALSAAFFHFDPNVLAFRQFPHGFAGTPITHAVEPRSGYYGDDLRDLADQGVNFTTAGRSIIAWPEQLTLGKTNRLITGKHYLGEVEFVVSGDDYTSEAVAVDSSDTSIFATSVAPTRAYYGRVQRLVADEGAAGAVEMAYLAKLETDRHGRQMPVVLVPPSNAPLSPTAPVSFSDLVCGMVVPLSVTDPLCRKFDADMILTSVGVSDTAEGETISIGLAMLGTDGFNSKTKPWTMKRRLQLQERINRKMESFRRTHS